MARHSGEAIVEPLVHIPTSGKTVTGKLGRTPVRPGTVLFQWSAGSSFDDSNGHVKPSGILSSGSINYQTGIYSLTFSGNDGSLQVQYKWDSEPKQWTGL